MHNTLYGLNGEIVGVFAMFKKRDPAVFVQLLLAVGSTDPSSEKKRGGDITGTR